MKVPPAARCERVLHVYGRCPDAAREAVDEGAGMYGFYCGLHAETVRYEQDQKTAK